MYLPRTLHQAEARPEFFVEASRIIPHHIKPAAFCRTLRAEGADDHMPARFHRSCDITNVRQPVFRRGQKVKNCAIMPDIVGMKRQAGLGHIGTKPADGFRQRVRLPFARQVKGNMRNIQ